MESTSRYHDGLRDLTLEELNVKPNEKDWSIGQVVDHIITTNSAYYPVFDDVLNGQGSQSFIAKVPGMHKFLGNLIYKSVLDTNPKKIKTAPVFEPAKSEIESDLWDRFDQMQEKMQSYVQSFSPGQLDIIISSPASPLVVYKVSRALDIICVHEKRHLNQALNLRESLLAK